MKFSCVFPNSYSKNIALVIVEHFFVDLFAVFKKLFQNYFKIYSNMKKYLHFISFLLTFWIADAQKIIENTAITKIVFDTNGNIYFYQQLSNRKFIEIEFDIEFADEVDDFEYEFVNYPDDEKDEKEIGEEESFSLYVKDIQPIAFEKLMKQLQSKSFSFVDNGERSTYFWSHPSYFSKVDYDFEEKGFKKYRWKIYGDLGRVFPERYVYYFIHFGNNRYITVISEAYDDTKAIIYNTKRGLTMVLPDNPKVKRFNKNPVNLKDLNYVANPENFRLNPSEFYYLKETDDGKYTLQDAFAEQVLPEKYDTIVMNDYFFVGKIGERYKIYNSFLKEIPSKNVKSVFMHRNVLDFIENNELKRYDINGKIVSLHKKTKYRRSLVGCGFVSYFEEIKLKQNKNNNAHYLTVMHKEGFGSPYVIQDFVISNISSDATLQFINQTTEQIRSDEFLSENEDLILAQQNGRYGLYSIENVYRIEYPKDSILKEPLVLPQKTIELPELLPIQYDQIYKEKDRVYFSKGKLHGILGITNDAEFVTMEKITTNYYRVSNRNGKKGWVSYSEKKVFWDN